MSIAAFLVGMVGPLMARWLASMGLSIIVLAGLGAAVSQLRGVMLANLQALPGDALLLGGLCGVWECLGIWLGAVTFCVTWASTRGFWALAKT